MPNSSVGDADDERTFCGEGDYMKMLGIQLIQNEVSAHILQIETFQIYGSQFCMIDLLHK